MRDLVEVVGKVLNKQLSVSIEGERLRPEASEVQRLISCPSKAEKLMGWKYQVDLETGVRHVVDYLKLYLSDYKPAIYSV